MVQVKKQHKSPLLLVARIGRLIGLNGGLKLHILSDFSHIFKPHSIFHTTLSSLPTLRIFSFDQGRNIIIFDGFTTRDSAAKLINCELYSSVEESRAMCNLKEGEFLWEELVGVDVYDRDEKLGCVKEIERIGELDYLIVSTLPELVAQGFAKQFYVPHIKQYVLELGTQKILTSGAKALLEAS